MIDTSVSRHSMHPAICQSRILPCHHAATRNAREIRQTLIRQRIRGGLGAVDSTYHYLIPMVPDNHVGYGPSNDVQLPSSRQADQGQCLERVCLT